MILGLGRTFSFPLVQFPFQDTDAVCDRSERQHRAPLKHVVHYYVKQPLPPLDDLIVNIFSFIMNKNFFLLNSILF